MLFVLCLCVCFESLDFQRYLCAVFIGSVVRFNWRCYGGYYEPSEITRSETSGGSFRLYACSFSICASANKTKFSKKIDVPITLLFSLALFAYVLSVFSLASKRVGDYQAQAAAKAQFEDTQKHLQRRVKVGLSPFHFMLDFVQPLTHVAFSSFASFYTLFAFFVSFPFYCLPRVQCFVFNLCLAIATLTSTPQELQENLDLAVQHYRERELETNRKLDRLRKQYEGLLTCS